MNWSVTGCVPVFGGSTAQGPESTMLSKVRDWVRAGAAGRAPGVHPTL